MKKQIALKANINTILSQIPPRLEYCDALMPYIYELRDSLSDILQSSRLYDAAENITINIRRPPNAAEYIRKLRPYLDDNFCRDLLQLHICFATIKKYRLEKYKLKYTRDIFRWY